MLCGTSRDSLVDIATQYGLDGQGIESPLLRNFPYLSRLALGPTQPPIHWVPGHSRDYSGRGVALITRHITPNLKKEWSYTSIPSLSLRGRFYGDL